MTNPQDFPSAQSETMAPYLQPTHYIDSDSKPVVDFALDVCNQLSNNKQKAIALYYAVRDGIYYDVHAVTLKPECYTASYVLAERKGFCIQKSILLTAVCRAAGIPSRVGFSDVRNHLATEKLIHAMKTDIFYFHGYNEIFINNRWIKCTPAFNKELCSKFGVAPLEFDGEHDSVFHPYDPAGHKFMDYICHHGTFADFPYERMVSVLKQGYPHLFGAGGEGWP